MVEFFSSDVMIHPVTNRPADKRSFIPSLTEKEKVMHLTHLAYLAVLSCLSLTCLTCLSAGVQTGPCHKNGLDQTQAGRG